MQYYEDNSSNLLLLFHALRFDFFYTTNETSVIRLLPKVSDSIVKKVLKPTAVSHHSMQTNRIV